MKKVTILFLSIFTVAGLYSQSYEIDFAGTGDTTVVDSVRIENLNQDISLTLNGNDVLKLNIITTGIHNNASDINSLQVYPNPMTEQAEIQFYVAKSSNVLVVVYDISGRSLIKLNKFLHPGMHKFHVSGLHQGMYTVRINEQNSFYTAKLISQNRLNGEAEIEYVSSKNLQLNQIQTKQLKSTASTIEMPYIEGDRLLFKGMTGSYATIITDVPSGNNTITFDFMNCTDIDDYHYPVVRIGTQTWMAENLRYLPSVVDSGAVSNTIPYYYVYGYHGTNVTDAKATAYYSIYGVLYNWPAAMNEAPSSSSNPSGVQGVCPAGWHLPSDAEWTELTDFLGGESIAGSKLKETGTTHWISPNIGTTNETGFTALPGGYRYSNGAFEFIENYGFWWSATEYSTYSIWGRVMLYSGGGVNRDLDDKRYGFSVRCVRD